MSEILNQKQYDLEDRTLRFAKDVRAFIIQLPKTAANVEDGKQVIRSSGSVGANYQERLCNADKDLPQRSKRNHLLVKTNSGKYGIT